MNKSSGSTVHLSTVFIFVFTLLFFVLVLVPGQRRLTKFKPMHRWMDTKEELQHGWPFVYSSREFEEFYSNGFEKVTSNVWTPWSSVTEFSVKALILDVVIALIIAGTISSVFQYRRRRRTRLLQFRLIDAFVAVTAIAAVIAWSHRIYDSDRREMRAIQQLNIQTLRPRNPPDHPLLLRIPASPNADTESSLPTWFDSLGILPRFRNVVGLRTTITHGEHATSLGSFRRLRYLYLHANEKVDLSFLEHTRQLRVFHPPMNFNEEDARHLCYLTKLEELNLSNTQLTDSAMVHLSGLRNLKSLMLPNRVSSGGLRNIQELTNLEILHLPHRMGSGDLEFLRRLTSLRELRLGWGISEYALSDLRHLKKLKQIEYLPMDLSDDGLKNLKALINLEHLRLDNRRITDDGLHHLAGLTKLKFLDLSETQVSDAGLANLSCLAELEFLDLSETEISDDGLTCLSGLGELKDVLLYRTHVTDEGVDLLQKAMPDCKISH